MGVLTSSIGGEGSQIFFGSIYIYICWCSYPFFCCFLVAKRGVFGSLLQWDDRRNRLDQSFWAMSASWCHGGPAFFVDDDFGHAVDASEIQSNSLFPGFGIHTRWLFGISEPPTVFFRITKSTLHQQIGWIMLNLRSFTPWKINVEPENAYFGRWISFWNGPFSGANC